MKIRLSIKISDKSFIFFHKATVLAGSSAAFPITFLGIITRIISGVGMTIITTTFRIFLYARLHRNENGATEISYKFPDTIYFFLLTKIL